MLGITLERNGPVSLSRQICARIRELVLRSRLAGGDVLPSSRELARSLGVSRNTVTEAYEMLWAEGYIAARQGSRHRVEPGLGLAAAGGGRAGPEEGPSPVRQKIKYDFRTGIPDIERFPFAAWRKLRQDALETVKPGDMLYGEVRGHAPLRREIAGWLLRYRGLSVDARSVFVTSGATQAIALSVDTLCRNGGSMLVENPCHVGITRYMDLRGVRYAWAPVDENGLRLDRMAGHSPAGVYVTPSHQFPLGHVMSAGRRTRLVAMARERGFYVVEDDYDSEYRYGGPPLTPLHALAPDRVIYVGTFSKTLFPALRIGYAVVPEPLHETWSALRRYGDVQNPIAEQVQLAAFLGQRKMDRHVAAMTRLYRSRRGEIVAAVERVFGGDATVLGDGAGLHMAVRIRGGRFGREFKERCRERSLSVTPCSRYVLGGGKHRDTVLLGYGNIAEGRIAAGVRLLGELACAHA